MSTPNSSISYSHYSPGHQALQKALADGSTVSTRDQYAHALSTFSHPNYTDAPRQCLAAFDELQSIGLEAFTKKHDPYWNIPLNENLPEPVIDLPIPEAAPDAVRAKSHRELFEFQTPPPPAAAPSLPSNQLLCLSPRGAAAGDKTSKEAHNSHAHHENTQRHYHTGLRTKVHRGPEKHTRR